MHQTFKAITLKHNNNSVLVPYYYLNEKKGYQNDNKNNNSNNICIDTVLSLELARMLNISTMELYGVLIYAEKMGIQDVFDIDELINFRVDNFARKTMIGASL